jgi:putative transposase
MSRPIRQAEWTAQQLREAFPFEQVPKYLLRDRDRTFATEFTKQVEELSIEEVLSAPRSPWQRAYIEWAACAVQACRVESP